MTARSDRTSSARWHAPTCAARRGPRARQARRATPARKVPAGAGITADVVNGDDVANYQDLEPLATGQLTSAGDYVVFANLTVHNTGASDDYLECGLFIGNQAVGGGGVDTTAGNTSSGSTVGAISVTAPTALTLKCRGHSATTFDLSHVTLRIHNFG